MFCLMCHTTFNSFSVCNSVNFEDFPVNFYRKSNKNSVGSNGLNGTMKITLLYQAGASEGSEQTKHWRGKSLFTKQWLAPPMLCLLRAF